MWPFIEEFGFKIPCLVRGNGEVVDGHLPLKAAHKLGIAEVPVILCDEWSPEQVKAFRLMVNRSVNWADWDDELLAQELKDIVDAGYDNRNSNPPSVAKDSGVLNRVSRGSPGCVWTVCCAFATGLQCGRLDAAEDNG